MNECLNPNKTQSILCPIKLKFKFKSGQKGPKLPNFNHHSMNQNLKPIIL